MFLTFFRYSAGREWEYFQSYQIEYDNAQVCCVCSESLLYSAAHSSWSKLNSDGPCLLGAKDEWDCDLYVFINRVRRHIWGVNTISPSGRPKRFWQSCCSARKIDSQAFKGRLQLDMEHFATIETRYFRVKDSHIPGNYSSDRQVWHWH